MWQARHNQPKVIEVVARAARRRPNGRRSVNLLLCAVGLKPIQCGCTQSPYISATARLCLRSARLNESQLSGFLPQTILNPNRENQNPIKQLIQFWSTAHNGLQIYDVAKRPLRRGAMWLSEAKSERNPEVLSGAQSAPGSAFQSDPTPRLIAI